MVKVRTAVWRPLRSNPSGRGCLPARLRHRSFMYRHTASSLFLALRANSRRRGHVAWRRQALVHL